MSKTIQENLSKMNTTGIAWEDMSEAQRMELRWAWDAVVSDPNELYCTCPRTECRNNHNCRQCVALHRYYDALPDCLRPQLEELQAELPQDRKYNMHLKIMSEDQNSRLIDPNDAEGSRERLVAQMTKQDIVDRANRWAAIVRNPKNTACPCPHGDCWYHGNCTKCIALHRHFGGYPYCVRYIVDDVDKRLEDYRAEQSAAELQHE